MNINCKLKHLKNKSKHMVKKLIESVQSIGYISTFRKLIILPIKLLKYKLIKRDVLFIVGAEQRFTRIYERNYWGDNESVSGPGSTFEYTKNLRDKLPTLFNKYKIASILDAPCGDLNWMKHVLDTSEIKYIGADIVPDIIKKNKANFENDTTSFLHLDITKGALPKADLMICRDCLFHLSYSDINSFFLNFISSDIPYLLTTTHVNNNKFENTDIETGDVRAIDLFSPPFSLPKDVLCEIEDYVEKGSERVMCLWHRDQLIGLF